MCRLVVACFRNDLMLERNVVLLMDSIMCVKEVFLGMVIGLSELRKAIGKHRSKRNYRSGRNFEGFVINNYRGKCLLKYFSL